MSKIKTMLDTRIVKRLIMENFTNNVTNLFAVKGGEISQAFSFDIKNKNYIFKIRETPTLPIKLNPYQKEINAFNFVTSKDETIPIPKIIKIGSITEGSNKHYIV